MTQEADELRIRVAELELELKARSRSRTGEQIVKVLSLLIKWGAILGCVFVVGDTVKAFAGEVTLADIGVSLITDIKADVLKWIFLIWGGGATAYGIAQRRLRKKNTQYLAPRNTELEKIIDTDRTSSQLPPTGSTREDDKP